MSSAPGRSTAPPCRLRLPATSANLGPGFDAVAIALTLYLDVEAAAADAFSIHATGRNADVCGALEGNLLLDTYRSVLRQQGSTVVPLSLHVNNGIPLGMGCGSSAAVILAGVALAAHFGGVPWSREQILAEACAREGHPDNAAACWLGGFTVAAMEEGRVYAASTLPTQGWKLMLALPQQPLATKTARSLLPESYTRHDAIFNVQRVALLTAAFAQGRGDLLRVAMQDRMHQPYRLQVCPLLPRLLPLAGEEGAQAGILAVALSGAGPAVLLVLQSDAPEDQALQLVEEYAREMDKVELLMCGIECAAAEFSTSAQPTHEAK